LRKLLAEKEKLLEEKNGVIIKLQVFGEGRGDTTKLNSQPLSPSCRSMFDTHVDLFSPSSAIFFRNIIDIITTIAVTSAFGHRSAVHRSIILFYRWKSVR
jgi:hypothetical protein